MCTASGDHVRQCHRNVCMEQWDTLFEQSPSPTKMWQPIAKTKRKQCLYLEVPRRPVFALEKKDNKKPSWMLLISLIGLLTSCPKNDDSALICPPPPDSYPFFLWHRWWWMAKDVTFHGHIIHSGQTTEKFSGSSMMHIRTAETPTTGVEGHKNKCPQL